MQQPMSKKRQVSLAEVISKIDCTIHTNKHKHSHICVSHLEMFWNVSFSVSFVFIVRKKYINKGVSVYSSISNIIKIHDYLEWCLVRKVCPYICCSLVDIAATSCARVLYQHVELLLSCQLIVSCLRSLGQVLLWKF